jgi:hypothetical protein
MFGAGGRVQRSVPVHMAVERILHTLGTGKTQEQERLHLKDTSVPPGTDYTENALQLSVEEMYPEITN